jgi:hypothetical protein
LFADGKLWRSAAARLDEPDARSAVHPAAERRRGDRGRESQIVGSPSLRTVRAVFPHTALRSVGSPQGSSKAKMGFSQTEQATFRKVVIRPTPSRG